MSRAAPVLAALRASFHRHSAGDGARVALGDPAVDMRLGGGLARAALHELFASDPDDGEAAAGFALLLALRAQADARPLLWVREARARHASGRLHAPGLAELGADPDRLMLVEVPDTLALLRAGGDIVKCGGVGAVVIEPWGKATALDLTASRRLAFAAERSGVFALLLRSGSDPPPSAAHSRWRIASAPSVPLPGNAPGLPAFDIELIRHRGGTPGFFTRLEWDRDEQAFRTPLSVGALAAAAVGTGEAPRRIAA